MCSTRSDAVHHTTCTTSEHNVSILLLVVRGMLAYTYTSARDIDGDDRSVATPYVDIPNMNAYFLPGNHF